MIRIFSIEDHWLITEGLRQKFRRDRDGMYVSQSELNINSALENVSADSFDIILLDLFLPGSEPIRNIKKIREQFPGKPVVILSSEEHEF